MGISIDEKRVYDASEGPTPVYVVGEFGVARVNTSDDLVGEFGLSHRCTARDAAGRGGRIAVATDEDVLVGIATGDADETEFQALGVGPAVAVGFVADGGRTDEDLLIVREEGTVIRGGGVFGSEATEGSSERSSEGEEWTELGDLADEQGAKDERSSNGEPTDVRAVDGDLVATASGVYRATDTGLQHVGLEEVRDVSTAGVPLAATASGLYRLGNGWMDELDGEFHAVSAASSSVETGASADTATSASAGTLGWAHAASADGLLGYEGARNDEGEWREVELPVEGGVVALDHGGGNTSGDEDRREGAYAVTDDGTFLLSVGDGWNHQILGLQGVRAVAAP